MARDREISPELLGVYASLVFVIGSLITLAASIIDYRQNRRSQVSGSSAAVGPDVPFLIN